MHTDREPLLARVASCLVVLIAIAIPGGLAGEDVPGQRGDDTVIARSMKDIKALSARAALPAFLCGRVDIPKGAVFVAKSEAMRTGIDGTLRTYLLYASPTKFFYLVALGDAPLLIAGPECAAWFDSDLSEYVVAKRADAGPSFAVIPQAITRKPDGVAGVNVNLVPLLEWTEGTPSMMARIGGKESYLLATHGQLRGQDKTAFIWVDAGKAMAIACRGHHDGPNGLDLTLQMGLVAEQDVPVIPVVSEKRLEELRVAIRAARPESRWPLTEGPLVTMPAPTHAKLVQMASQSNLREYLGCFSLVLRPIPADPAMLTVRRGDVNQLKELLRQDPSILKTRYSAGQTLLDAAATAGELGIVKTLAAAGVDIGKRADGEWTPLHSACVGGYAELVDYLLGQGASVAAKSQDGDTPLHVAQMSGNLGVMEVLLKRGADANAVRSDGSTPIFAPVSTGNAETVKYLLAHGAKADIVTKGGATPLHVAAGKGSAEIAAMLIAAGGDPRAQMKTGASPLHLAAMAGHVPVAKLLIDKGAPVDARGAKGWTPLMDAARFGNVEVVMFLLDAKADSNATTDDGFTALHQASFGGHADVAARLIGRGAKVDARDAHGQTPLHIAAYCGMIGVVKCLLASGADVKAVTDTGITAQKLAAERGHDDIARLLAEPAKGRSGEDR
ncbi:MAG TPA: ankyrin repeat domain-containing protein [Planctomycetota bacterium]|nr:ankyrin repeat domain-containing protein [Planctomycetota bacterium]